MSGDQISRPLPRPTSHSALFWSATTQGRFVIQRCASCSQAIFYPKVNCPSCGSIELGTEDASGRGSVYTYTVARRPTHSAFAGAGPSVIAIVELEEGPHVTTNIIDCDPDEVFIGMAVDVTFADEVDGIALPLFRPALAPRDRTA